MGLTSTYYIRDTDANDGTRFWHVGVKMEGGQGFCILFFFRILALPACWWWCSGTEYNQTYSRRLHVTTTREHHGDHSHPSSKSRGIHMITTKLP